MFKSVILAAALSFFALSSAEAVRNGNIFSDDWFENLFKGPTNHGPKSKPRKVTREAKNNDTFNTDDWFKDFNNAFKRLTNQNHENKSRTLIEEAIAIDFKNGQRAVYSNKNGFKLNNPRPAFPLAMTPTQIRYGDVLINRRLPLNQVLEGLQTSKNIKQADLRTLSVSKSNAEVYTSTQSIIESPYVVCKLPSGKVHNFYTQSHESKSTFDKRVKKEDFLNRKSQEFDRDLASFLNVSSAKPAQPKAQAKPVAKPKAPVKPVVPVKMPAKVAPVKAPAKTPVTKRAVTKKVVPVKKPVAPKAAPSKVRPAPNTKQTVGRRTTTSSKRGLQTNRSAARRATLAKHPAAQRNTRAKHIGLRRKR
ncbi:MAG: hypothetical protein K2Y08_03480 [Alphaproteobacteria bacterium]|nr:hypothetical protein [Alphaproteobacteria bacterium]